jgi:multidrug resistance efflux pump
MMTWSNRLRLFLGLIAVVLVVAGCTLVFNQRQTAVTSMSASVQAQEYAVGTDYGGTVTREYVEEGDRVAVGDKLFQVQSLQLQQDIDNKVISPDDKNAAYTLGADGLMTFTAAVAGTMSNIGVKAGGYVQSGTQLATIDRANSLFVSSNFILTPRDYERISRGASVDLQLPNTTVLVGTVRKVSVETDVTGQAKTTVEVSSPELRDGAYSGLTAPGTPIDATLHLRDDGPLAGVSDGFHGFMRQIGL